MNPASKEMERGVPSIDEMAMKEVDGYIERIEKQSENKGVVSPLQPSPVINTPAPSVSDDMGKIIMQSASSQSKPKIVLPLDEEELKRGLHHKIFDALRWLAEWSVYIIRKYPGRVFYKQK